MKKKTEDLSEAILDAAAALFIEKGIGNVTTREVTAQLGLSRSHIYHYYKNWQLLSLAAVERYMTRELSEFVEEISPLGPEDKLARLTDKYLPDESDAGWKLYDSLWQMAANDESYLRLAEENITRWMSLIESIIREGMDSNVFRQVNIARVTRQLGAMLNGYAEVLSISPAPDKHRLAADDVADFLKLVL